jgi:hypothetical protein
MALLSTGATTLAAAAATDAWALARAGFTRLLGRGDATSEAVAASRLDALDAAVQQAPADLQPQVRREQQAAWLVRLSDLVEEHPELVDDLQAVVAEVSAELPAEQQIWVQHNIARDHGQVFAAQGGNVIIHQAPPASEA